VGRYDGIACKYEGCSKTSALPWILHVHYDRHVRAGVISIRSDIDRFQAKTAVGATCYQGTNCVIWTGAKTLGYGSFRAGGHAGQRIVGSTRKGSALSRPGCRSIICAITPTTVALAERIARTALMSTSCTLETVSPLVNSQRGRKSDPWTHCKYGHPMTPDNLHTSFGTRRRCKTCANAASHAFRDRRRAMRNHDESPGG
jgi:bacterioferritin-associated ferredoxin